MCLCVCVWGGGGGGGEWGGGVGVRVVGSYIIKFFWSSRLARIRAWALFEYMRYEAL